MSDKYEMLLERSVRCQEQSNDVSKSLLKYVEKLDNNTKELNDNFALHQQSAKDMMGALTDATKGINGIKNILMKWVKWLGIALFVSVGGATVFRIMSGIDFTSFIK